MDKPSEDSSIHEEQTPREAWFDEYVARFNARTHELPQRCPCCRCKTLGERANFEICEVCFWEDDGQDDIDADECRGGPNGSISLSKARTNYLRFGACEEAMIMNVRPPRPDEMSLVWLPESFVYC